jgi:hypothetical protein
VSFQEPSFALCLHSCCDFSLGFVSSFPESVGEACEAECFSD